MKIRKSLLLLTLALALGFVLVACGSNSFSEISSAADKTENVTETMQTEESTEDMREELTEEPETTEPETLEADANAGNVLIAYFSVMETDDVDTMASASRVAVNGEVLGNNQYIAQILQRETGGDLFAIETVQEYPTTHDPLLEFAYNEKTDNARPELATQIENLDSYDVIFLGYPNWNADLPMPLYTFLEEYDFSGKTIIPFTTHGGSGFSRTIQTISDLQPNATVISDGLSISRNSVSGAESDVVDWVNGLNLTAE